jgi:hypothetical protein
MRSCSSGAAKKLETMACGDCTRIRIARMASTGDLAMRAARRKAAPDGIASKLIASKSGPMRS